MKKRTVLIVDDQIINRKILERLLSDEFVILTAENGKHALDILQAHSEIAAVLLDIVMPVMNGYEVLKIMRSDPVMSLIPVIVSSQKDGDDDEVKALSLGAYDFIAKPYKADIIRHRLRNTIRLRETAAMINKMERDSLTGLYNKQFFFDKVREKLEEVSDTQYDMFCLGVERFKLINDTYGEQEGDKVLCHIADVLQEMAEPSKICCRFSADEFYALIPHTDTHDKEQLRRFYERINDYPIDMEIKAHWGAYWIKKDSKKSVSAMCDRAKLSADANRGNYDIDYFYYDDSLRQKLLAEQFITSHMYAALEEQQFQVYYQPKYDLDNEKIAGAEALVRWIHPEKGFMSPGVFIPVFEKNGFIRHLDYYVWEKVCKDMRNWIELGYKPVSVSVNVSRADIYNPKIVELILGLIEKYQIPIQYLHLEITESAYMDNPEQIVEVVSRFRELGFIIEMDDFGSGYSSLNMLAQMPVDVLKLDMKFVQMESENTSGKGIMSFVISLAKWLNLAVVAEGVETGEQIASLRSMNCNYVQGFYYAKPMPLIQFEELLKNSKTTEMVCSTDGVKTILVEKPENLKVKEREILIVDDIAVNRAVLASIFLDEYIIVEKENGKEALEYLLENYQRIDLILLDWMMPVMDGFQLLKIIREKEQLKELPVVITSQGDIESEQRALDLEADDFIAKPYRADIVRHRVHNVIGSYKYRLLQKGGTSTNG